MNKLGFVFYKMRVMLVKFVGKFRILGEIHYINGPETLPAPLTKEEEASIMKRINLGDEEAREPLITHNLRLVVYIAKKFDSNGASVEDLISIGTIGLIKAVNTFDNTRGNRLSSYAAKCIDNEILMLLRSEKKLGREVSLYEPIGVDREGNEISLYDILETGGCSVPETVCKREQIRRLYRGYEVCLKEKEQKILRLRYGLFGGREHTQKEIGAILGISRSYVSRIEKSALEKLRSYLTEPPAGGRKESLQKDCRGSD